MSGQLAPNIGLILLLFIAGMITWAVLLVITWNDADETYGTGLFWGMMVLFVPWFALPVYWLMRLGTHRSWQEDIEASERHDRQRLANQRLPGINYDPRDFGPESVVIERPRAARREFTPYRARFADEIEAWCRDNASNNSSSQGCGDSQSGFVELERTHVAETADRRETGPCTGRHGGDGNAARTVPF